MSTFVQLFLSIVCIVFALLGQARADSQKGTTYSGSSTSITEYSRIQSKKTVVGRTTDTSQIIECGNASDVSCQNLKQSTVPLSVTVQCGGSSGVDGGWTDSGYYNNGRCFDSVDVYYQTNGNNVYAGTVNGQLVSGKKVEFQPYSLCVAGSTYDAGKQACAFNYVGGVMKLTPDVSTATSDDMFKVVSRSSPSAAPVSPGEIGAFFEYPRLASSATDLSSGYRLNFVLRENTLGERYPARAMMMPSGPGGSFNDFKRFIDKGRAGSLQGVSVENACYPVNIHVCNPVHIPLPAMSGQCGASNGNSFYTQPGSNLCHIGGMSAMAGTGPWTWTCNGLHGGGSSSCSARLRIDGQCGGANRGSFAGQPASQSLCAAGGALSVTTNGQQWLWACNGVNGGTNASCQASVIQPGRCGSANGQTYGSAPAANLLCAAGGGTASNFAGSGPWSWSCANPGGSVAQCSAQYAAAPQCGPSATMLPQLPTSGFCTSGNAVNFGTNGYTWDCQNNAGQTVSCHTSICAVKAFVPNSSTMVCAPNQQAYTPPSGTSGCQFNPQTGTTSCSGTNGGNNGNNGYSNTGSCNNGGPCTAPNSGFNTSSHGH